MSTVVIDGSVNQIVVDGRVVYTAGGGVTPTPPGSNAPPITVMPPIYAELPSNNQMIEKQVANGEVVGYRFTTVNGAYYRQLNSVGAPNFFSRASWAIFDSAGSKVMGQDNVEVNSGGIKVDSSVLLGFGAGPFTYAVATNGSGNLASQFNQQ